MTGNMSQDEKLFEEAFDLIIMLQAADNKSQVHRLINRWRARDAAHEAAWCEAMSVHSLSGALLQVPSPAVAVTPTRHAGFSRRQVLFGGGTLLAASGLAVVAGPQWWTHFRADASTTTALVQQVQLEDGTRIALGPDSAIRYQFTPAERRVELLSGMAYIDVADDDSRTFHAVSRALQVTTHSSAFDLSQEGDQLSVALASGRAEVLIAGNSEPVSPALVAGDWLTLDITSQLVEHGHRSAELAGAWRDGTLVVEGETIASVVARIARWQPGKVMIADGTLGTQRISGVYNLDHPLAALKAAVQPRGGKVREFTPWLTIISAV